MKQTMRALRQYHQQQQQQQQPPTRRRITKYHLPNHVRLPALYRPRNVIVNIRVITQFIACLQALLPCTRLA